MLMPEGQSITYKRIVNISLAKSKLFSLLAPLSNRWLFVYTTDVLGLPLSSHSYVTADFLNP